MKKIPAWLLLCIISLVAGLALGFTNALTKEEIARQDEASNELARKTVMSEADEFVQLDVAADSGVDYCYEATSTLMQAPKMRLRCQGHCGRLRRKDRSYRGY